jgi:hypothetical protein
MSRVMLFAAIVALCWATDEYFAGGRYGATISKEVKHQAGILADAGHNLAERMRGR